jgi:uncharacterized protein with HEPN domain
MRPEDAIRLTHMIDSAEKALRFVENRSREDLENDELLTFALTRAIEILGEAASRIAPETRTSLAQVPWDAIIGMRNRLVHAYFNINLNIVWKTATEELPKLLPLLRAALADGGNTC